MRTMDEETLDGPLMRLSEPSRPKKEAKSLSIILAKKLIQWVRIGWSLGRSGERFKFVCG